MKRLVIVAMLCIGISVLVSCGGGSSSSDNTNTGGAGDSSGVSGVVVDPYIEGARFCIDVNLNYECDAGEPLSSYSNEDGEFEFSSIPTDGDIIVMETAGEHNGVPYSFDGLMGIYEGGDIVVSPLTTMYAAGLTAAQIVEMLDFAGLTDVTQASVLSDPMDGLMNGSDINAANLAVLRSSIASYMFMKIIDGSDILSELSAAEVYASAMDNTGAVYQILSTMAGVLNQVLSQATLTMIEPYDDMLVGYGMNPVSFEDVIDVSVSIADKIAEIGYTACNNSSGTTNTEHVTDALTAVNTFINTTTDFNTMIGQLGPAYYLVRVKGDMSAAVQAGVGSQNATWGSYLQCASESFVLDDAGVVSCYAE